jgi:hypothetical protein
MELKYQVLKLKTGDSIISEVNETTDNTIFLHRPMVFKLVTMLNETMTPTDVLLFRNWAEFSKDEDISISKDIVASSWTPDEVILNCYQLEKLKQDMPEIYKMLKKSDPELPPVNPPFLPGLPMPSPTTPPKGNNVPNGMANFNLTLPMDVAKGLIEYLEQNGVNLQGPDFDDMEDFGNEDDISESIDDMKDESFGNHPDDWSPDPNDYTK